MVSYSLLTFKHNTVFHLRLQISLTGYINFKFIYPCFIPKEYCFTKLAVLKSHTNVKHNGVRIELNELVNCFFVVWLTDERRLALFPAETIVRDLHHRESLTRREQSLNLRRICSDSHYTTAPHYAKNFGFLKEETL